jgi:hypothetical protein
MLLPYVGINGLIKEVKKGCKEMYERLIEEADWVKSF